MKKILFALATVICSLVACDPVSEDFSIGGHITADELKAMSTVTVEKDANGKNGNVISCSTSAPVNAKWTIDGKDIFGNYAWKKLKTGEYKIVLTGLCADGTIVTADFPVSCEVITQELGRYILYGKADPDNPNHHMIGVEGDPLTLGSGDAAAGRFSDNEGKGLPTIKDDVYSGNKTLIFDIIDVKDGPFIWGGENAPVESPTMRVMNGWWSTTYADDVPMKVGLWELFLSKDIAAECPSKDLDLLMTRGSITIKSVYYEE